MRTDVTPLSCVVLSFAWAGVAMATNPLNTPPLLGDASTHPSCVAFNTPGLSRPSKPVDVTVELFDDTGALLSNASCPKLAEHHACATSAPSHTGMVFCRISANRVRTIRGTLMLIDGGGTLTSAVASREED